MNPTPGLVSKSRVCPAETILDQGGPGNTGPPPTEALVAQCRQPQGPWRGPGAPSGCLDLSGQDCGKCLCGGIVSGTQRPLAPKCGLIKGACAGDPALRASPSASRTQGIRISWESLGEPQQVTSGRPGWTSQKVGEDGPLILGRKGIAPLRVSGQGLSPHRTPGCLLLRPDPV